MGNEIRHSMKGGLFAGLFVVAVGLVFLLDQQGIVSADYMFRFFWPALFIFFGLDAAMCRTSPMRRNVGIAVTAFGGLMLLSALGIVRFHIGFELIWPLAFIWFGAWIIWRSFMHSGEPGGGFWGPGAWSARLNQVMRGDSNEDQFDNVALFGGVKRRIASKNFKGGSVMSLFGGFQIDLSRAEIEGDTAVVNASSCLGGGEIRVPETWLIDVQGIALLGGYVDETHQIPPADPTKAKRLILKGTALMGGIVIKN
jgi:hypothetical protein